MAIRIVILTCSLVAGWAGPLGAQEINRMCPVMPAEAADPDIFVVYQGKKVAFCCDRCVEKFEAEPEKYLHRLPQFAADAAVGPPQAEQAETKQPPQAEQAETRLQPQAASPTEDQAVPWLGRVHPAIVHFPVAGIPLALLGFLAWALTGRSAFAKADVVPLLAAALSSIAAVLTGDIAHDAMRFSASMHEIVERHEFLSTTVMILVLCLTVLRLWRWKSWTPTWQWVYGVGLCICSILVGITGFLGGSLVFGPDHLAW